MRLLFVIPGEFMENQEIIVYSAQQVFVSRGLLYPRKGAIIIPSGGLRGEKV